VNYTILILLRAEKEIDRLPHHYADKIDDAIESLRVEPRPHNCKRLKDRQGWRIRVGEYRVIYEINDAERIVRVVAVRHRSEACR
jgi:mRNA interferase RelE/StbE